MHSDDCSTMAASPATPPSAPLHRLGHLALRVEDMERAIAFYGALGLRLTWQADDWAYMQWPRSGEGLALLSSSYTAAGPHFALHFQHRDEVDAVHAALTEAGHRCGPVHDHRDGTASFYLRDPEGNWLEMLYEPAAGIPSNVAGQSPIPPPPLAQPSTPPGP
jgi:catechol 2,3-dioxygenase-like lactoylglutathione lyase family enzyme